MNLKSIHTALVLFLLAVLMLVPAKTGMGQGLKYAKEIRGWSLPQNTWYIINKGVNNGIVINNYPNILQLGQDGSFRREFQANKVGYLAQGSDGVIIVIDGQTVTKYSSLGAPIWVCQLTSSVQCEGFDIASDGRIFIADSWGDKVWVLSADGTSVNYFTSNQLSKPCNVRCLPDGTILVQSAWHNDGLNTTTYTIQFTSAGEFIRRFNPGALPHMLYRGIDVDEAGNLWCFDTGALWSYDSAGNWRGYSGGATWPASGLDGYYIFYENKKVFSPNGSNGSVRVFDIESNTNSYIYSFTLNQPRSIAQQANGDYFIADTENHRIVCLGPSGQYKFSFGSYGTSDGQFVHPSAVTVTSQNSIVVGELGSARLQEFNTNGNHVRTFSYDVGGSTRSLVSKPNGDFLVSDGITNQVMLVNSNGGKLITKGGMGTGSDQYRGIGQVAIDDTGAAYVVDSENNRVHVYDHNLNQVSVWGTSGTSAGELNNPSSICFDRGSLIVGDQGRIQRFSTSGTFITSEGSTGNGDNQFSGSPATLFVNAQKQVVAIDSSNHRMLVYDNVDSSSPTSTFSANPSSTWSNTNITATINSTDNAGGSGVKEIHYSINQGTEQIVASSTASFNLSDNGIHSISYFAVDNAGNTETAQLATVKIDKIAPVSTLGRNAGLITLSATDAHSGLAKIKYQVNGGAVADYSVPFAETIHKVTYWAEDAAGNIEAANTDIINAGVHSISVTQARTTGGLGTIGTVTLDKAAGVGGTVINLASSLPGVAVVDPTITIPEGATTASFDIDANPVAIDTSVSITASIYETSQSALITVQAPMPVQVSWSNSPVSGGTSTTGTLIISGPAPTGGTTVSLASSSLSALVPTTVTIPAGSMTTTFNVSTNVVSNDTSAVISATVYGVKLKSTLSILGPKVSSITLAASSVASLGTTTGTVTLSTNAPVGGKVVNLSSSNASVASVSVSVTVAAGTRTVTFTITAGTVNANTNATITATTNNSSGTATITVTPPAAVLSNLTTVVTSVTGGVPVTGTVVLTSPAPTGGAVVTLSSSSTTIGTVPASVIVAAGATSATFTITTSAVTAASSLTITATRNGVSKTATITVNPVRVVSTLTLNPTSVRGGTNSTGTVTLTGIATEAVVVTLTSGTTAVARVLASVTVPAGSTTATFTITTLTQTATRTSIITARTGTTSRTATLSVTR